MTELFPVVAAALIDEAGHILMQRRPEGKALAGLWEFPGGKVERSESPEEALCRELGEELGIVVAPGDLSPVTFASQPLGDRHMILMLYRCRRWIGDPQALALTTTVNGATIQSGSTRDMVFPVAELIAWLSSFMTLSPGDMILTGTPHGVHFVSEDDAVICEVERVGRLAHRIGLKP